MIILILALPRWGTTAIRFYFCHSLDIRNRPEKGQRNMFLSLIGINLNKEAEKSKSGNISSAELEAFVHYLDSH